EQRRADAARLEEEKRRAELARAEEEKRRVEAARLAEEQRRADAARADEERRRDAERVAPAEPDPALEAELRRQVEEEVRRRLGINAPPVASAERAPEPTPRPAAKPVTEAPGPRAETKTGLTPLSPAEGTFDGGRD